MSERELYEAALIEMNKVEAPSLLLEDYNYFINKAVQQYINKVYNRYDINQQSTDDLRVLKATAEVKLQRVDSKRLYDNDVTTSVRRVGDRVKFTYEGVLPKDYMHLLNCIVDYRVNRNFKCYKAGDYIPFAAKRLTADMASGIINNVYMKPDYKRPYFYINNVNTTIKADLTSPGNTNYKDGSWNSTSGPFDQEIINNHDIESVNPDGNRVANATEVRIEIRFGEDDTVFTPEYVYIDYIKAPMFIKLTYDDITSSVDNTRILEFPDYVCFEIVNEFVKLLMENASDPRLQTNYAINQTIGDPTINNQQKSA
jgi:hypothetical protein